MKQNKFPISCTKFSLLHRDEFTLGFFDGTVNGHLCNINRINCA